MKIAILDDSIGEGIGRKKYNYENVIETKIEEAEVKNFSMTGTTINYAIEIISEINLFNPDLIIVGYGNVDAMVRPRINKKNGLYKFLPKRYKKNGMLDPRAFISKTWHKAVFQKFESFIRNNIKKILMKTEGTYSWVEINEFEKKYKLFIDNVNNKNRKILMLSTVTISENFFPKSPKNFRLYNEVIKKIAKEKNLTFIDLYSALKKYPAELIYGNDSFHPNKSGYEIIANILIDKISND